MGIWITICLDIFKHVSCLHKDMKSTCLFYSLSNMGTVSPLTNCCYYKQVYTSNWFASSHSKKGETGLKGKFCRFSILLLSIRVSNIMWKTSVIVEDVLCVSGAQLQNLLFRRQWRQMTVLAVIQSCAPETENICNNHGRFSHSTLTWIEVSLNIGKNLWANASTAYCLLHASFM